MYAEKSLYDIGEPTVAFSAANETVFLQAINRAGLSSNYVFAEFGIDQSPPTGGHVMDGIFQTDVCDTFFIHYDE